MRGLIATAAALLTALAAVGVTALPANAAGNGVEVSADDVTYASTLPGALFTLTGPLVPGDAVSEDLWVRNTSTAPGLLRVSLIDVVTTDAALAAALTMTTSLAGGGSRPAVPLSAANPCAVLLEGPILEPGETRRLVTELILGDLTGQVGQGATAWTSLRVALVDPAYPGFSATDCGPDGAELPVLGEPGRTPSGSSPSPSSPGTGSVNAGAITNTATGVPDQTAPTPPRVELPVLPLPFQAFVDPNTGELNLLLLFIVIGSFLGGTVGFIVLAWRRRAARETKAIGEVS
jgi:hypothetical protein